MNAQPKPSPAPRLPARHPQWEKLDLAEILALPTAYLAIGYANSILSPHGAQNHERLWERGRMPGGAIHNTVKLVHAARRHGVRMVWTKYRIFRQEYPQSPMDKIQYDFWASHYPDWTEERKQWDWRPVEEIAALMRPGEPEVYYTSLGNVFLGTMLPAYLNMWGIRTVLLSGYHLDWCIEQAARTCRDMGYMPIVIGDACGCGVEADEAPTLERLERFFAPVVSSDEAIALLDEAAALRGARQEPVLA
jgi:nicotinamidase-related amidase